VIFSAFFIIIIIEANHKKKINPLKKKNSRQAVFFGFCTGLGLDFYFFMRGSRETRLGDKTTAAGDLFLFFVRV
jgi:hypothetical protein